MERRQGGQAERMKNDSIPPNPHPVKPPPNMPEPRKESLEAENARLKAEVERLRKAGDELLHEWSSGDEKEARNFMKALVIWNAAKEGKPSA